MSAERDAADLVGTIVWLVERDLGGYDYLFLGIFTNEHTATAYRDLHFPGAEVRAVYALDAVPEPDVNPPFWGTQGPGENWPTP